MTSAATFFPAKFTAPASIDLKVDVNLIAADSVTTAVSRERRRHKCAHSA